MKEIKMTINSINLDYVKEKVEKFNKKALKLNKKQIEVTYSNSYIVKTRKFLKEDIKELVDTTIKQYEELIINNYKIIAEIDHTYPEKNFVKPYTEITEEQEQEWQHIKSSCQHCNSNRKRKYTYILQNISTLEYIQVGKTCLKDFLGHDIENKLKYFNLLEELKSDIDIIEVNNKTKKVKFFNTLEVLGMIQTEIKENSFKSSRAKQRSEVATTTAEDVKDKIKNMDKLPAITQTQEKEFKNIINYILKYDTKEESEYLQEFYNNLKNILKYNYCKIQDVNILATVFNTYTRLESKEKTSFVGNVKDKIEIEVTLVELHGYVTQYGYMNINIFKDKQGNIYKWNSKNTLEIEKGEWKTIKATIKDHQEHNGQKQTVLTRCKLV